MFASLRFSFALSSHNILSGTSYTNLAKCSHGTGWGFRYRTAWNTSKMPVEFYREHRLLRSSVFYPFKNETLPVTETTRLLSVLSLFFLWGVSAFAASSICIFLCKLICHLNLFGPGNHITKLINLRTGLRIPAPYQV